MDVRLALAFCPIITVHLLVLFVVVRGDKFPGCKEFHSCKILLDELQCYYLCLGNVMAPGMESRKLFTTPDTESYGRRKCDSSHRGADLVACLERLYGMKTKFGCSFAPCPEGTKAVRSYTQPTLSSIFKEELTKPQKIVKSRKLDRKREEAERKRAVKEEEERTAGARRVAVASKRAATPKKILTKEEELFRLEKEFRELFANYGAKETPQARIPQFPLEDAGIREARFETVPELKEEVAEQLELLIAPQPQPVPSVTEVASELHVTKIVEMEKPRGPPKHLGVHAEKIALKPEAPWVRRHTAEIAEVEKPEGQKPTAVVHRVEEPKPAPQRLRHEVQIVPPELSYQVGIEQGTPPLEAVTELIPEVKTPMVYARGVEVPLKLHEAEVTEREKVEHPVVYGVVREEPVPWEPRPSTKVQPEVGPTSTAAIATPIDVAIILNGQPQTARIWVTRAELAPLTPRKAPYSVTHEGLSILQATLADTEEHVLLYVRGIEIAPDEEERLAPRRGIIIPSQNFETRLAVGDRPQTLVTTMRVAEWPPPAEEEEAPIVPPRKKRIWPWLASAAGATAVAAALGFAFVRRKGGVPEVIPRPEPLPPGPPETPEPLPPEPLPPEPFPPEPWPPAPLPPIIPPTPPAPDILPPLPLPKGGPPLPVILGASGGAAVLLAVVLLFVLARHKARFSVPIVFAQEPEETEPIITKTREW